MMLGFDQWDIEVPRERRSTVAARVPVHPSCCARPPEGAHDLVPVAPELVQRGLTAVCPCSQTSSSQTSDDPPLTVAAAAAFGGDFQLATGT